MAGDLDIVGVVGVDVVPVAPNFHNNLKAMVLPAAVRVGEDAGRRMGQAIGDHIAVNIPDAVIAGGRRAQAAATREGGSVGGAFGRAIKRKLEEAFRSLPRADVRLGDTGINADIDRLRARIQTLAGKTVGVDIDAGAALAEIQAIDERLARLAAENPSVQVRTDTAAARAALAEVQRQINDVDRDDVKIRVKADTAGAIAALRALGISIAAVAAIPVIPVAAAGIGAITSAAVAAGAGIGALALAAIPAIKGVTSVMQLKTAADKEAATATNNSAAANVKAAQSAIQMANAQASLASARRQAAQQIAQANRQVEDAERALGQAAANAMDQRRQAAESVARAERSLSDAQRQARQAEEDLTAARRTAAQQLADLNDKLKDGALSQRDAALRVQEAADELNRVKTAHDAGTASDTDLARAQLSYDQALQAQAEQSKSYKQLQSDAEKARKAGVDGNDAVKTAAQKLADAQRNVKDQTTAVADAQRAAARTQVQAAQQVADAQRNLSDAIRNVGDVQTKAADSVASAERGVESARLSSVDTTAKAATATDAYRQALAKLTPEQRDLYDALAGPKGLTNAFKAWSTSLQPDVLPLFTRAVNGAKSALPGLTPLVKTAADAVGVLFDKASKELKSPFWRGFKKDIETSAKPAIIGLGVAFGNIIKGMAGIIDGFLPHMDDISSTMQRVTGKFADWATGLKGSPEFERFLSYSSEHGPLIASTLGSIADAFLQIGEALSPISGPLLKVIGAVADGIASVADTLPWLVQLLYAAWAATKLWTIAMAAFNLVADANPIVLIALAILGIVAAVVYAWKHFEGFRDVVKTVWKGIEDAALFAWNTVLKPVFDGLMTIIKGVGDVAVWLWQNVFQPVFSGIWLIARIFVAVLVTAVFTPILLIIEAVGAIAMWLWTDGFKPMVDGIVTLALWLWNNVLSPVFHGIWNIIKWVGDKFVWLYDHAVKPFFGFIADKATWLWHKALKPTFDGIWDGIKYVGDKFKWLYDHSAKPIFDGIADIASWLWKKGLKPAFDSIKHAVSLVGDAFGDAKNAIKSAWDNVAGIAAKPINFIIDTVYTHGVKAVWDKVAGFVGLDKLPKAPKLLDETPKFAGGGRTYGGTPGVDSIPILAMADEFIIKRSSARKIGFDKLAYMNSTGEIPRFAGGGIVGDAWDWTKNTIGGAVSKGVDWAKTAGDLLLHPSKIWNQLVKPILSSVTQHLSGSGMADMLAKIPFKAADALKDKIVEFASGGGGHFSNIGGAIPSGKRRSIISQAMAAAHVPPPGTVAQWLAGMNTLITRESGWNANARNDWDINAKNGTPSGGLAQVIWPTFKSNHVPGTSWNLYDPVANVAASIRYITRRYGNITNVQQANSHLPPKGYATGGRIVPNLYDDGGYLPAGLSLVANGTGKPEPILTSQQWDDLRSSRGGTPNITVDAPTTVIIDGNEVRGIVDQRIAVRDADTGRSLDAGRYI
ncbi:hypothetical protein ACIBL8_35085 [Streptomyces sp. NPDC050523]|uniref:hypothetical protein n=1 Tax=Streptomyces sp. NPDC050523 TaxID=3365622 RepID=UPI0037965D6B